jgi:predicted transcriptional regulator
MELKLKKFSSRNIAITAFIMVLALLFGFSSINRVLGDTETDNGTIAVFYGSQMDKQLSESLVIGSGRLVEFYNITSIQLNNSFVFNNESVDAIWWISRLPLPIDLTFVNGIEKWKDMGRGLFVLNRYFHTTPLQELNFLGITAYAPVVYPLNGSYQMQEISIIKENLPSLNLSHTLFEFSGSSAWVNLDNQTQILAEINPPSSETILGSLKSGFWIKDKRTIVGSFSINIESSSRKLGYRFHQIESTHSEGIIDALRQIALLTISDLPSDNGYLLFEGFDQLISIGVISFSIILTVLALLKVGFFSKIREVIMGVFTGVMFFVAHVAYSPQRRRISEEEILDNELRVQILNYLEHKGELGAHLREIQRNVKCGISSLIGKYHIFYPIGEKSIQSSEIALALKSNVAKDLCRVLIKKRKPLSLSQISNLINAHHSSVQHHIKKLIELGIILTIKEKKRASYLMSPQKIALLDDLLEKT